MSPRRAPDAGELRTRFAIESLTRTADEGGGHVETWNSEETGALVVWGAVEALSAFERIQAMQTGAGATHRIVIRHRSGMTAAMRLRLLRDDRVFQIIGPPVDPDGGREWLEILAEAEEGG